MTTAWDHLPNAKYIDQIISNIPNIDSVIIQKFDVLFDAAWLVAHETAWDVAHKTLEENCEAARGAMWDAVCDLYRDVTRHVVWRAISGALLFLIAYDEEPTLLNQKVEDVKILSLLGNPQAIMLYPYMLLRSE